MTKKMLKKKFPLCYEIYQTVKTIFLVRKEKKQANRIHNMSKQELMEYDAELYRRRTGKKIDWNNLSTYTEKMQWAKLYDNNPLKTQLADKYAVRQWVAEHIGEEYLIPLLGKWNSYSEINFKMLPEQFVLKTNHGSGDVCIVKSKEKLMLSDKLKIRRKLVRAMKTDYGIKHCEFHYSKISPKIIAEHYIDSGDTDLQDYKFLCFDGVPYFCWVDVGRFSNHKRNVYSMDWELQTWNQYGYGNAEKKIDRPKNFDKMVEIATCLSNGFSHVRVDLYNVNGKIYFGEMTFTNGSGFEMLTSDEADLMLGNLWNLDIEYPSHD